MKRSAILGQQSGRFFAPRRAAGTGACQAASATMISAMKKLSRREFMMTASAAALAATALPTSAAARRQRVFIASNTPNGILAYDWDTATAELTPAGVAAKFAHVDWVTCSPDRKDRKSTRLNSSHLGIS